MRHLAVRHAADAIHAEKHSVEDRVATRADDPAETSHVGTINDAGPTVPI